MYTYHITAKFTNGKKKFKKYETEQSKCPFEVIAHFKHENYHRKIKQIDIVTIPQEN